MKFCVRQLRQAAKRKAQGYQSHLNGFFASTSFHIPTTPKQTNAATKVITTTT
jgi:hypothetical protein